MTERDRLFELLADEAAGADTSQTDRDEIARLLVACPDVERDSFERAAAALHLALSRPHMEPMPVRLRERVLEDAERLLAAAPPRGRLLASPWVGWAVAAAAVLLLVWRGTAPAFEAPPGYEELLARGDTVQASWSATEDPGGTGVTGEVVWDPTAQRGYMHFRGLRTNDPGEGQYQLWIFDADRPAAYPVDGGVFDSTGEDIVVPIDAKIAVAEPTLFAITWERPGGVVVSTREHLLLTAAPQ